MKVLALFGSPRPGGFSSRMHELFLSGLGDLPVTRFQIVDLDIHPCTACGICRDPGGCPFRDDMDGLYDRMREADLIVISSPVYFSSLPSALKAVIDRCQLFWEERERGGPALSGKRGLFISAAGSEYPGIFTPSVTTIRHFFNCTGIAYEEGDFLLLPSTDSLEDIPPEMKERIPAVAAKYRPCT